MRIGFVISIVFHAAIVLMSLYGLPSLLKPKALDEVPIFVEVVPIAAETNAPPPKPTPVVEEKKEPPKPEPAAKPEPKPAPPPPAPQPEIAALPPANRPEPEPEPKPKKEPEPEPVPEVKPKPEPKKEPEKPKPKATAAKVPEKPKPPARFDTASLLKTLADAKKKQQAEEKKEEKAEQKKPTDFASSIRDALKTPTKKAFDPSKDITMSELAAMQRAVIDQVTPCWQVNPGAKNAENLAAEIRVSMNPDGTVQSASVVDIARLATDPFFRAAAEAARRAVLNPKCNPLKLPPDKYAVWQTITINFDPRELL